MYKSYGRNFWIMSLAMFLFMTGFNLILPELNQFITKLGGEEHKGLIITLFTISAGLARPFSGKLSDIIGRKKVMVAGIILAIIICLLYPFSETVFFFLMLRFIHGFSVGFTPTGATALITDVLPEKNRGQGMGIWGTFISIGIGFGQSLGSWIYAHFGMNTLFAIAAITTFISGILVYFVNETLQNETSFKYNQLKIGWRDVFEPNVMPAAMVMWLTAACSGVIFVLTPDISGFLNIENKGWFFGIYVIATIIVRLAAGTLSDNIGRRQTLIIGISFLILSMLLIGYAKTTATYTLASLVFGIATGITSPTLFAWTADLSPETRRGVGAGTMFIALEFGIMLGSASTLITYNNTFETVTIAFLVAGGFATIALSYVIWHLSRRKSAT
jgi:MFS family permease